MKKLSILSMLLLFISMGNIQAQTVKEESRKQKKKLNKNYSTKCFSMKLNKL